MPERKFTIRLSESRKRRTLAHHTAQATWRTPPVRSASRKRVPQGRQTHREQLYGKVTVALSPPLLGCRPLPPRAAGQFLERTVSGRQFGVVVDVLHIIQVVERIDKLIEERNVVAFDRGGGLGDKLDFVHLEFGFPQGVE